MLSDNNSTRLLLADLSQAQQQQLSSLVSVRDGEALLLIHPYYIGHTDEETSKILGPLLRQSGTRGMMNASLRRQKEQEAAAKYEGRLNFQVQAWRAYTTKLDSFVSEFGAGLGLLFEGFGGKQADPWEPTDKALARLGALNDKITWVVVPTKPGFGLVLDDPNWQSCPYESTTIAQIQKLGVKNFAIGGALVSQFSDRDGGPCVNKIVTSLTCSGVYDRSNVKAGPLCSGAELTSYPEGV
jgi:hypothetical protein